MTESRLLFFMELQEVIQSIEPDAVLAVNMPSFLVYFEVISENKM